jgi:O-antigen/teichoic acid export membrane protein
MTAESAAGPKPAEKLKRWLLAHRTSARLAFVLNLVVRLVSAVMSFVWTPMLLNVMGGKLYGLFITFQAVPQLGGLGDFGIGGAIGNRTGQMVGRGDFNRLREFLAAARSLFLGLGLVIGMGFLLLSPWLPGWLHFQAVPGSGSLPVLFAIGAASLFLLIVGGYFHNLNAAYGTVAWPILPGLFITQAGMLTHWLLARAGSPLWAQYLSYVGVQLCGITSVWFMLRAAHPWLWKLWPLKINRELWRELATASGWMYLYSLGGMIFLWTDRLLVNAGFGAAAVTPYVLNYKPCDIILQVVLVASFVSLPKLNQWIASGNPETRERARVEGQRLNLFQAFAGTAGALGFLAFNHPFIKLWTGADYLAPAAVQRAFALTMAITASGSAGIQMAGVCGQKGLRTAGLAIAGAGLLNLAMALTAMKGGWLPGIAWATVIAQSFLNLTLAHYTCRHLALSFSRWAFRSWVLPVGMIFTGEGLQYWLGADTWTQGGRLFLIFLPLMALHAPASGLTVKMLRDELVIFRRFLPGRK